MKNKNVVENAVFLIPAETTLESIWKKLSLSMNVTSWNDECPSKNYGDGRRLQGDYIIGPRNFPIMPEIITPCDALGYGSFMSLLEFLIWFHSQYVLQKIPLQEQLWFVFPEDLDRDGHVPYILSGPGNWDLILSSVPTSAPFDKELFIPIKSSQILL